MGPRALSPRMATVIHRCPTRRPAFDDGNCITDATTRSIAAASSTGGSGGGGAGSIGGNNGGGGGGSGDGASGSQPHPMRLWTFLFAGLLTGGGKCIFLYL